jgi:hypothetical protein
MTRPRTRQQRATFVVLSIVAVTFAGWFVVNPGRDLVVAGYDYVVAPGCINGLADAGQTYQGAAAAFPADMTITDAASRYLALEEQLDATVASLRCPIAAADEQAAFLELNAEWVNTLKFLQSGGQVDAGSILQIGRAAQAGLVAFEDALKPYGAQ